MSGKAPAGQVVAVTFQGQTVTTGADANGAWKINLPPVTVPGGPFPMIISSGSEQLTLAYVLIGDIWFCSGQSNMEVPLRVMAPEEVGLATVPGLRLLKVPHQASSAPVAARPASWRACTPSTISEFSALAYFFGRDVNRETGVPVGLIMATWGGKRAEVFTRREILLADPVLKPIVDRWDALMAAYPEALSIYEI
ncbi:MAG TPA: hypothetical protein VIS74_06070, partial [Chthoniobacterales bacterium]